ncbi:probable serine--glyoxylate aminotransferase, class V [Thermococcus kodakarensis KOD1]|uniref:Probable serine--glyoxylate aminotransferase, class V n=1 Tax=Thermococcus kodakarensis (strain ATCC BAA-918 / JCM 12380 / KOD1) TaxID=69014 RepID=Q5JDI4_THEKO|nr:alanine--glyoxylate aminotransferase family protein [Thermococcus kodakarensis]WCN29357.1 alanine--glyoxylate aminotransferase family protein [Thermococcus kodakarensis]WCN31649.1 alanine--glyoxylate aminotransferase family protein [Thermococcus kodakarensis]BAD85737.1 probable serine--glyoxylate aminotransferase, class V [Thermococcus kodakarensis KOD1]
MELHFDMTYEDAYREVYEMVKPKYKLFTAGPVACFPEVLAIMSVQMFSHRSAEAKAVHVDTLNRLKAFLEADKGEIILFPSSGTGFMEAAVRNTIPRGGKVLVTVIGAFGKRFADVVNANGREAVILEKEPGKAIKPEELDDALRKNPDVHAVTITYNETSTGVLNPLPELAKVVQEHDKLLFVDAVSAMGGADIKFDKWGLDMIFASSQKAFGVPPGLAVAAVSERVFEIAEKMPERGWYFDLPLYKKFNEKKKGTPSTPPLPQIFGLNVVLRIVEKMGGKEAWLDMYRKRSEMIREGVKEMGLGILAEPGYESPTITAVVVPEGMKGVDVYNAMRERGFELAKGYGSVAEKTFRIGNMGYMTFDDIREMLDNLREVIEELKKK